MTAPVVALDNIFVSAASRPILDVTRFSIARGEVVALVGPNGAGKTTLLHVAALLRQPDRGTVAILGHVATPANAAALRRALSIVFQDPLLFAISVLENAAAGVRFQGLPRVAAERQARLWLERFGVAHLARQRVRGLSGGETRRVALARAFATKPALLLLDEPFSALDAPTREKLLPELRAQLGETDAAAILVTHDLDEAITFAERIALMDGGRVIAFGEARSLIARPPSRRVAELLGVDTILPARIARRDGDTLLLSIEPDGPTLHVCAPPDAAWTAADHLTLTIPATAVQVPGPREPASDGWNILPGRVISATPQRAGTRLVVETPAHFTVLAPWQPTGHRWAAGDTLAIAFPPDAIHVIIDNAPCATAL